MAMHEQSPLLDEKLVYLEEAERPATLLERPRKARGWISPTHTQVLLLALVPLGVIYACIARHYLPHFGKNREGAEHSWHDTGSPVSNYTCIPGQTCWPSMQEWSAFNRSVSGNLKSTIPWAMPCYRDTSSDECKQVISAYGNGFARTSQYGAMEFTNWESCGESTCHLSTNLSSLADAKCTLGRLSTYHVEARSPVDISETLNFARKHGLRVSIKNTGHDYFGRSNAANSLAIWTHRMKDIRYHKIFQPQGCKTNYKNIGEIGAGIQAQEAWEFFEPLGMFVTVGAVSSVGIAGGFGQGGGHGPLGPRYGLMVDQAVEFEVITADGKLRTINECTDPDLFWAMRGGGGGNYGVLTAYKFQLHPAVPINVYYVQASWHTDSSKLNIAESKIHRDIVKSLASHQSSFAKNGIAGYNFLHPDHICSLQVMPSTDVEAIKNITSEWHDLFDTYPGLNVSKSAYFSFKTFSEWHKFTETPEISRNGRVGLGLAEAGRFMPKDMFESETDVDLITNAVVTAMQFSHSNLAGGIAQIYATGPFNQPDNSKTGVNPAWRTSLWHVIMAGGWLPGTSLERRMQIQNTVSASIQPFKTLTPGGSCYMNEGDWTEENWQQTFFGKNYDRLLQVKKRYDPSGLFNCWKCVGWTGYNDPMYSCYAQGRQDTHPSIPLGPVNGN